MIARFGLGLLVYRLLVCAWVNSTGLHATTTTATMDAFVTTTCPWRGDLDLEADQSAMAHRIASPSCTLISPLCLQRNAFFYWSTRTAALQLLSTVLVMLGLVCGEIFERVAWSSTGCG